MVESSRLRALLEAPIWPPRRHQVRLRCGGLPTAAGPILGVAAGGRGSQGGRGGAAPCGGVPAPEPVGGGRPFDGP
jgi:hypothetical protein